MSLPPEQPQHPLHSVHTGTLTQVLQQFGISLAITTYQAGKLVIARADGNVTNTHFRMFDKPMGMAIRGNDRLTLGAARQVIEFRNVPAAAKKLEPEGRHDACYLPQASKITGDVDIHEMAWAANELWFINTRFSCLCTLDSDHSFVPRWHPPFITAYDLRDRCHLNGLAIRDDRPRYVTALGQTDEPAGWRRNKAGGGILMDIDNNQLILDGLSMPHSPRWYRDRLWFLESGKGTLSWYDPETRQAVTVAELPGFTRGFDFAGDYAFIGLSKVRESAVFAGLPLTRNQPIRHCGVWVVDIRNGQTIAFLRFEEGVQELFAVNVLPWRFPDLINDNPGLIGSTYILPDAAMAMAATYDDKWESTEQHFEAGNTHYNEGRHEEALASFRRALALQPDFVPARFNLGVVLGNLGRYEEAVAALKEVIAADAAHADAYNNLGYLEAQHGDPDQAIRHYETAITIAPNHAQAHLNLGMGLLRRGDYTRGFEELEWRWRTGQLTPLNAQKPRWDGTPQRDKTLLLHTEQGVGDTVQMGRFIPWAAERVGKIVLLAPEPLQPLMATIPGITEMRAAGSLSPDSFDLWLPMMSLPLVWGLRPDNIPASVPYLTAPHKAELQLPRDGRLRIGICWAGSPTRGLDRFRSTELKDWLPLLEIPDVSFYSLQIGETAETQLEQVPESLRPVDLAPRIRDWGDTAAFMQQLDLLISVDTGVVHLAGALNRPTWVMLYKGADWRYPESGETMPWYPSMRLFRQSQHGIWQAVMEQVAAALRDFQVQT